MHLKLSLPAWLLLGLMFLILVSRIFLSWQAFQVPPGTTATTGCEETSWQNLIRIIEGGPIFIDEYQSPFVATYFNWLFYTGYAAICAPVVETFGPAFVIPAGRFLTSLLGLLGAGVSLWWMRSHYREQIPLPLAGVLACFPFLGTLNGWWVMTVRPDTGALAFEAGAIAALLLLSPKRPWLAMTGTLLCLMAAWSMKPNYVSSVPVAVVYLALVANWRPALALALLMVVAWGLALLAGGSDMYAALVQSGANNTYSVEFFLTNLREAMIRGGPVWLWAGFSLLGIGGGLFKLDTLRAHPPILLGSLGLLFIVPFCALSASKVGASVVYWIPATLYASCLIAGAWTLPQEPGRKHLTAVASLWLGILLSLTLLVRMGGQDGLTQDSQTLARKWETFRTLPEPRFSSYLPLNLSWLNPDSPPYVLSYNYTRNRASGVSFEGGGLGGAVERGEIQSLLLSQPAGSLDGADLSEKYQLHSRTPDTVTYLRRSEF